MVKQNTAIFVGLALLAVIAAGSFGLLNIGDGETVMTDAQVAQTACSIDDKIEIETVIEDVFTKGTTIDVLTYLYSAEGHRVASSDAQADLDASALTDYTLFAFDDASTGADGSYDWYGVVLDLNTDCKDPFHVYIELYKETNAAINVWNEDGSVNSNGNTAATEMNMTAGTDYEVEFKIKAPNDASMGAPESDENMRICFDYNSTAYDSIKLEGATKTDVPSFDLATTEVCYDIGIFGYKDTLTGREEDTFTILIETDDAQGVLGTQSGDINIRVMDPALYVNGDTGLPTYGVQDENGDEIGLATSNLATIYAGG